MHRENPAAPRVGAEGEGVALGMEQKKPAAQDRPMEQTAVPLQPTSTTWRRSPCAIMLMMVVWSNLPVLTSTFEPFLLYFLSLFTRGRGVREQCGEGELPIR